jgi:hypothetical protein
MHVPYLLLLTLNRLQVLKFSDFFWGLKQNPLNPKTQVDTDLM